LIIDKLVFVYSAKIRYGFVFIKKLFMQYCQLLDVHANAHKSNGGLKMQIMDLEEKYKPIYFLCLEDWSDEIREAGDHKKIWYNQMKEKGLGVKIAIENEKVYGMIQYLPIKHSFIDGSDLYFIHCIWVHGHKQGLGNQQKKGIGKKLLQAAEDDVKIQGANGIVA
jgi:hypothetical protein